MSIVRTLFRGVCLPLALAAVASAATGPNVAVQPQARIVHRIDNAQRTRRPRTTTPLLAHATDQGRIDANTPFRHMMLVLKNTDEQELALAGLLDQQQDKSSPNYHQWMSPESFGAAFGVAASDLVRVTAWLQESGFTVEQVTRGARLIEFSGTSGQIEAAFHTEMHRYVLNGETHTANALDVSIPSALAPVVLGVASLNDFNPKNHMLNSRRVVRGTDGAMYPVLPGTASPDYTQASSGAHYVGAGDIATIFNTKPLLAAGIDGTGVKIGIIGQTDILLSDIQTYRTLFNLPPNNPTFTQVGTDPGTNADDGESGLDVELAGGAAPGATINFVTSGNSFFGGGIDAAGVYLVESNSADIISLSYGICETSYGPIGNAFYNALWEQAASQGQTVFVSSGDAGPATCDSADASYETQGYAVNALASTPFNVAVGGTQFNEGNTTGATPYWGPAAGAPYSTALGYIPEAPLNESRFGDGSWPSQTIFAGGSGISFLYPTPSFQTGPGVPTTDPAPNAGSLISSRFVVPGPHRYLPDVSLISSVYHDSTIYCSEGSCRINADGTVAGLGLVGGTSVAAPTMAGIQALINQKNGGRQGNANYYFYRIAAAQSRTDCVSATYNTTAGCSFHDGQVGTTNIPSNPTGTSFIGWSAAPGYDLALGLGSPDVTNLANAWSTVSFNATTTSFTLAPATAAHGTPQNITIAVTPVSGSGTPSGDVSLIAASTSGAGIFTRQQGATGGTLNFTLAGGTASGTLSGLPGGTYSVYAHYAGDTTYGGSNSAPVTVTISPEGSVLTATSYLLATNGALTQTSTYTYGADVYLSAQVAGVSGTGTPTGSVLFNLTAGNAPLSPITSPLDSFGVTYFDAGLGFAPYDIMPTAPVLPPGNYTATLSYAGDPGFNASHTAPLAFTINPASQPLNLRAVSTEITSGATATFNASLVTVAPNAGGAPATGTITFTDATTSTVLGTGTLVNGALVFTTAAITTAGSHTITATYSGDANYLTKTTSITLTVGGAASTLTLAASTLSAPVGTTITLTATASAGATGTVFFYDNGISLGGSTITSPSLTASLTLSTWTAGTHTLTATSSGNATQAAATSASVVVTVTRNTPTVQLTTQSASASQAAVSMSAVLLPSPRGGAGNNPPPTGAIQFVDGTTVLGTAAAVYLPGGYNNYVASYTTPALKPGPHTLAANYTGDANFAPATSNRETVNIGLTTPTLIPSATSVSAGTPFTLTDRIVPQIASTASPGGTVTFYDATTPLGISPVLGGSATLANVVLVAVGPHTITAVYSGDTSFYTSTTPVTTITVTAGTATPSLMVSAATVQVGASVTITASTPASSTGTVTFFDSGASLGTATLAGINPTASLTITGFTARSHSLTATYNGDASFLPGTSAATLLTVTQNTPVLQLAPLQNTATAAALTLSAALIPSPAGAKPNNPAPTGSVQYSDGTTILGAAPLVATPDGTYAAPFTTAILRPGPHAITAVYPGDPNYASATSTVQSVTLGISPIALATSVPTAQVGTTVTLTASLPTPATGTVMFFDNGASLGSAPIVSSTASLAINSFSARLHTLTATYSGDTTYYTSTSAPTALTITPNTPTLQLAPVPNLSAASALALNAILAPTPAAAKPNTPAPTGSVQYSDGTALLGSAPLVPLPDGSGNFAAPFTSTVLRPGSHSLSATYSGDTNYTSALAPPQVLNVGLTTVTLTASTTAIAPGIPFLLTANITPSVLGSTSIGGTVTFADGTSILGSSIVTSGTASLTASLASAASPTHTITAAYSGDASFSSSTSNAVTVNTVTPTLTLSVSPASLTLARGSSGTAVISISSSGNYVGTLTATCAGLPLLATCTFSPASLVFNGTDGSQTTSLAITTTAPVSTSRLFSIPAMVLAWLIAIRRRQASVFMRPLLLLALMLSSALLVSACGSSISQPTAPVGGTPTGSSTITLTLTAPASATSAPIQSTALLTLNVQ